MTTMPALSAPPYRKLEDALPALNALTARKSTSAAGWPQMRAGSALPPAGGSGADAPANAAFDAVRSLAMKVHVQLREQPLHIANHRPQAVMMLGE